MVLITYLYIFVWHILLLDVCYICNINIYIFVYIYIYICVYVYAYGYMYMNTHMKLSTYRVWEWSLNSNDAISSLEGKPRFLVETADFKNR
jgi:hypothetical protein